MRKLITLLILIASVSFAQNVKSGEGSLKHITTGYDNTVYGVNTGYWLSSGYRNVLIGYKTGMSLTTGYNNIFIGNGITADSVNQFNYLNIGGVIKADMTTGIVTIPKLGASIISGTITATDSTTSAILKDATGKKWKIKVRASGIVYADSTGLN